MSFLLIGPWIETLSIWSVSSWPHEVSLWHLQLSFLETIVCFMVCLFVCCFVPSILWPYATNPHKAAFDNLPGHSKLVVATDSHQPSSNNVLCALQLHCKAGTLPLQACYIAPVTETGGSERLVESPLSATTHLQVVVCSPRFSTISAIPT